MKNDLIGVIIPIYNNEKYFERCILSVIKQTYKNLEIILINDYSTDSVEKIILKYEKLDGRIKYYKNDRNMGVSYSRNFGIDHSEGKYIYFLDSDDYIESNCIEELYNAIKEDDSFSCMLSGYKEINGIRSMRTRKREELDLLQSPSVDIRLFNKKIIEKANIRFSTNLKIAEDLEFIYKIVIYNDKISYVDKPLYTYVIHKDSSINTATNNQLDTLKAMNSIKEYAIKLNKYGTFKDRIEFTTVSHILVGTIGRILRTKGVAKEDIEQCIDYVNKEFPNWKNNRFVKEMIFSNDKIVDQFKDLGIL